jgi:hypothetical protein
MSVTVADVTDMLEPEMVAQACKCVGEGHGGFGIPSRPAWRQGQALGMMMHGEGHHAVEAEQQRRCPKDRQVRPLALGFDPEMRVSREYRDGDE